MTSVYHAGLESTISFSVFIHSINSLQSSAKRTHSNTNIRRSAVKHSINQNVFLKGNYDTLLLISNKYLRIDGIETVIFNSNKIQLHI